MFLGDPLPTRQSWGLGEDGPPRREASVGGVTGFSLGGREQRGDGARHR